MIKKYFLDQLDKSTAWIGFIGLIFLLIGWATGLFFLFIALIMLPEAHFSEKFKAWTKAIREFFK